MQLNPTMRPSPSMTNAYLYVQNIKQCLEVCMQERQKVRDGSTLWMWDLEWTMPIPTTIRLLPQCKPPAHTRGKRRCSAKSGHPLSAWATWSQNRNSPGLQNAEPEQDGCNPTIDAYAIHLENTGRPQQALPGTLPFRSIQIPPKQTIL